jgi:hypothetical protein
VTDRVRRSHEQFFHFVKQPRYFSAIDEVREPQVRLETNRNGRAGAGKHSRINVHGQDQDENHKFSSNPLGKLPGSVWSIPSQPLTVPAHLGVDHFAAYPCEWPRRIILGWSPGSICVECGEGRRPTVDRRPWTIAEKTSLAKSRVGNAKSTDERVDGQYLYGISGQDFNRFRAANPQTITGYVCACPDTLASTHPAVVLDPFGGTGTTSLVASALGRIGISVDLSHDYGRLAQWRTQSSTEKARVLKVSKPPVEMVGQDELFAGLE